MSEDQPQNDDDVIQPEAPERFPRPEFSALRDRVAEFADYDINASYCHDHEVMAIAEVVVAGGFLTFMRGYIDELGKRAGDSTADWLKRIRLRWTPKGKAVLEVPVNGVETTFEVDDDMSDEAKLALIDLDLTSDDVRGHKLKWDGKAWVKADSPEGD